MNNALYLLLLKQEGKKILGYTAGLTLYEWMITWVYPILIQSPAIAEITKSFPTAVKSAFGVSTEDEIDLSYEAYVSAQLLGRIWSLMISIYGINEVKALLSQQLDQGFLAYPLSSPVSREHIVDTQVGVALTELALIIGLPLVGLCCAANHFEIETKKWPYLKLGILSFCLGAVILSYSFLIAVLTHSVEKTVAYAGALTLALYGLDVLSSLDQRLSKLKYLSPYSLYRPQEILQGKKGIQKQVIILSVISGTLFAFGRKLFSQQDLFV